MNWLWVRTEGEKQGRLVFSRNCKKGSQFGKDVFGKHMVSVLGKGMDCGLLRKRLEMDAARLAEEGTITPADRSMVSSLLQHSGKTAGLDYSGTDAAGSDSTAELAIEGEDPDHQESSESSADDDNGAADDMEDAASEDEAAAVQMDSEDEDSSAIIEQLKNRIAELEGGQEIGHLGFW